MRTHRLGRTGIEVSEICQGTMTWREHNSEREAAEQLDLTCGYKKRWVFDKNGGSEWRYSGAVVCGVTTFLCQIIRL